jgi:2-(1,2-epoxy-1,2-dihydrophenyl)acetyl-CoA isomerase
LAQSATSALGTARQLLLTGFANGLETQMELEARAISAAAGDAEGREGISAFLAKRRPDF